jgi:D-3-phosphoglycerate dehydrogenase
MTYRILVSDKLSEDGLEVFRTAGLEVDHLPTLTQDEIKSRIHEYDGWVVRSRSKATADIIEAGAKRLRVIGRAGVGVDNVDVEASSRHGIIVMNTPGGNTVSTGEHTIAMMMSIARKIPMAHSSTHAGAWEKNKFMGVEFCNKTLGILGFGRIGQEVAKRMMAFEMRVLAYDPFVSPEVMKQMGVEPGTVDEICKRADFITIHTPLSPETKKLINAERLKTMKKTLRLVNCARGGIVDEEALAEALKAGTIAGAALDVFEQEPLPAGHPLLGVENVILTPHIAASTTEAQENVAIQVAEQIVDLLKNNNIRNAINAPSFDPKVLETMRPYLRLCERLGRFAGQFETKRAIRLEASFSGSVTNFPTKALATAFAKGFIEPTTDRPINYVNARPILEERGIELVESTMSQKHVFANLLTLKAVYEDNTENLFAGTVFEPDHDRIVRVNDRAFNAVPKGTLVVVENDDVPGIIGAVGTYFGDRKLNISEMTWGRREQDVHAMTIINVEGEISDKDLDGLRKLPHINSARLIRL